MTTVTIKPPDDEDVTILRNVLFIKMVTVVSLCILFMVLVSVPLMVNITMNYNIMELYPMVILIGYVFITIILCTAIFLSLSACMHYCEVSENWQIVGHVFVFLLIFVLAIGKCGGFI